MTDSSRLIGRRPMRPRVSVAVTALLVIGAAGMLLSAPASAAGASYRFWTYWQGDGSSWGFASVGPAYALPADGSVDGWSFAVSAEAGAAEAAPAEVPDFDAICADVMAEPGRKRVGLVVDPGDASIAPTGESPIAALRTCVVADDDATGYEILRSVLEVRTEDGLVCGLGGYPADECAPILDEEAVAALTSAAATVSSSPSAAVRSTSEAPESSGPEPADDQGTPVATIAVIIGLGGVALATVALRRRRDRTAPHA